MKHLLVDIFSLSCVAPNGVRVYALDKVKEVKKSLDRREVSLHYQD